MKPNVYSIAVLALGSFTLVGCTGFLSDSGGPATSGESGAPVTTLPSGCAVEVIAAPEPRRLTALEFSNAVFDLFGAEIDRSALPADSPAGSFLANRGNPVARTEMDGFITAIEGVAPQAAERVSRDLGCSFADSGCVETFFEQWGRALYHREPTADERRRLTDFITATTATEGPEVALEMTMVALLGSPQFNYIFDVAPGPEDTVRNAGIELLLTRWSLALWQSVPTQDLYSQAFQFGVDGTSARESVVEWMLTDPRAERGIGRFVIEWLGVDRLVDALPSWPEGTAEAAKRELQELALGAYSGGATFADLMTTREAYVNDVLADVYGVSADPNGEVVTLGDERQGLLTRAAVMAQYSDSPAIFRGLLVRDRLLCERPPEPPAGLNVDDLLDVNRLESPDCAGCHTFMDPIGFAFDAFDAQGRFDPNFVASEQPTVNPIETPASDETIYGDVADAAELANRLATSPRAQQCYAENLLRYATRTPEQEWHACLAESVRERLGPDASLTATLVALLASGDFRTVGAVVNK